MKQLCSHCGKARSEHNAKTGACPAGIKHRTLGYTSYHNVYRYKEQGLRVRKKKR